MRIVVLDGYTLNPGDNPWDPVKRLGELVLYDRTQPDQIIPRSRDAEVLVTNKVPLDAATLARLPALKFITVTATGYDIVDVAAARMRGIPVANVPEYGTDAVAQFTFALLLELCHHVGLHGDSVRRGEWQGSPDWSYWKAPLVELSGKAMGVVGFGRIGRRVGQIAHAFGMAVIAADFVDVTPPGYEPFEAADVTALFARSDVVTLHCPLTDQSRGMVDRELLATMRPSAFLINTARGGLVVERDLAEALNAGTLAGAAVDVVAEEPIRPDNPLLGARNCLITPHLAWATRESRRRLTEATAENIRAFLAGRPIHVVNPKSGP